jgi:hypothetical protein
MMENNFEDLSNRRQDNINVGVKEIEFEGFCAILRLRTEITYALFQYGREFSVSIKAGMLFTNERKTYLKCVRR